MRLIREIAYFQCGGKCLALFEPQSLDELAAAMVEIKQKKWPYFFLGAGTNSLVLDDDFPGACIALHKLNRIAIDGTTILCEAGVDNTDLANFALAHNLKGCEWMHRLPGQIGATARMNARCYGGEISQIVSSITCIDLNGKLHEFSSDPQSRNVFRGYKDTIFMDNTELVIASVRLNLTKVTDASALKIQMQKIEDDRVQKQQFLYPSCGCVFKNNYNPNISVPSGILLDMAGAKSLKVGLATINPSHANFIANKGATSADILELSLRMRDAVYQEFGVVLEYEMEILGQLGESWKKRLENIPAENLNHTRLAEARVRFKNR